MPVCMPPGMGLVADPDPGWASRGFGLGWAQGSLGAAIGTLRLPVPC